MQEQGGERIVLRSVSLRDESIPTAGLSRARGGTLGEGGKGACHHMGGRGGSLSPTWRGKGREPVTHMEKDKTGRERGEGILLPT